MTKRETLYLPSSNPSLTVVEYIPPLLNLSGPCQTYFTIITIPHCCRTCLAVVELLSQLPNTSHYCRTCWAIVKPCITLVVIHWVILPWFVMWVSYRPCSGSLCWSGCPHYIGVGPPCCGGCPVAFVLACCGSMAALFFVHYAGAVLPIIKFHYGGVVFPAMLFMPYNTLLSCCPQLEYAGRSICWLCGSRGWGFGSRSWEFIMSLQYSIVSLVFFCVGFTMSGSSCYSERH